MTAREGFRFRFRATEPQPHAAVDPNSGTSSGTDRQLRSLIADAVRQLPFERRAVICRAYYQGWTTTEIAADLKLTEAAVKSRLHDGLFALRRALRERG
jgi:RNA polymerase sigma-70 factor (ECF subfamily)